MMTDWKSLCEELLEFTERLTKDYYQPAGLVTRARAALAGPVEDQAMPPRVGHVLRLAEIIREVDGNHDKGAAALAEAILSHPGIRSAGLASVIGEPSDEELLDIAAQSIEPYDKIRPGEYEPENNCAIEVYSSELIAFARAVLARYGHQPVAVAERRPGPEDCDAEGRCWWWVPACPPNSAFGDWQLHLLSEASYTAADATHWLPAIALPLPQGEAQP